MGLFSTKTTTQNTTNQYDQSVTSTLTDSLNTTLNLAKSNTYANSSTYNQAFDAVDSFNTVNNWSFANLGVSNSPGAEPLDIAKVSSLFADPAELYRAVNANTLSKDPNVNKYGMGFDPTNAGGSEFLKQVKDMVTESWKGMAQVPAGGGSPTPGWVWPAVIGVIGLFALVLFLRR